MYIYIRAYIHVCIWVCIYMYMHKRINACICTYVHMHVPTYLFTYIRKRRLRERERESTIRMQLAGRLRLQRISSAKVCTCANCHAVFWVRTHHRLLLGGPVTYNWLWNCSYNPVRRPQNGVSQVITGLQVDLKTSCKYPLSKAQGPLK